MKAVVGEISPNHSLTGQWALSPIDSLSLLLAMRVMAVRRSRLLTCGGFKIAAPNVTARLKALWFSYFSFAYAASLASLWGCRGRRLSRARGSSRTRCVL